MRPVGLAVGDAAPARASGTAVSHGWLRRQVERIPEPTWSAKVDRRLLAVLAAVAFGLRVPAIHRSYWVDEGISIGIAGHPLGQIAGLLRHDGSPPLFYWLLHFWIAAAGTSEVVTHVLPLAISLAVVPVAWWCGRTLGGRGAGLAAAALAATNPYLTWYATETRMYTLVCGLSLLAVTFTVRAWRDRRPSDVVAAAACTVALDYTHNWGLYLTVAIAGVSAARALLAGDRRAVRAVAAASAAVAVAYLPWLPVLLAQARDTAAPWAVPPGIGDLFADPATLLGGTLGVVVVPLLVLGALRTRGECAEADRRPAGVGLLIGVGVATLVLGWLVAQGDPSWTVRYLAAAYGPLTLAAALPLAVTARGRAVVMAVAAGCAAWELTGAVLPDQTGREVKSNVAAVAGAAGPALQPGDVVVVAQTEQLAVVAHYLPPGLRYVTPTGPVADPSYVDWTDLVARLQHADVCATVLPSIAALPVGASVLVIDPLRRIGASATTWSQVANGEVRAIGALVSSQPSLVATQSYIEGTTDPRPYSAVVGELYRKTSGPTTCVR